MFEGSPLPVPPWDFMLPLLSASALATIALAMLRIVQTQEWNLTWKSVAEPRSMWFGRHVEGGRTVGVVLSHLIGLAGWAILGWAFHWTEIQSGWMREVPFPIEVPDASSWSAGCIGVGIGLFTLPMRWGARKLAGWMAESPETAWQHGETDRYMRSVLTSVLVLEVLMLTVNCHTHQEVVMHMTLIVCSYVIFILWRGFRLLQLLLLNKLSIGWGIAYLCTLELIPTWALVSVLHLG